MEACGRWNKLTRALLTRARNEIAVRTNQRWSTLIVAASREGYVDLRRLQELNLSDMIVSLHEKEAKLRSLSLSLKSLARWLRIGEKSSAASRKKTSRSGVTTTLKLPSSSISTSKCARVKAMIASRRRSLRNGSATSSSCFSVMKSISTLNVSLKVHGFNSHKPVSIQLAIKSE